MKSTFLLTVLLALTVWCAGCSTPDKRIARSPEIFAQLTPDQQAAVKEGKVAIGFTKDAVLLAVGDPDRKWTRKDKAGTTEVWSYTTWENDNGRPLYSGWYHQYSYYDAAPYYFLNSPGRREREYFKVVFDTAGKVSAVEQDSR